MQSFIKKSINLPSKHFSKPPERVLDEYTKRCASLKTLTNYVQSPQIERKKLRSKFKDDSVIKEINQINQSNYTNALRGELLGTGKDSIGVDQYFK